MGAFPACDVKLCDFEISRVILEGTEIREILGTPDYVGEYGQRVTPERSKKRTSNTTVQYVKTAFVKI